MGLAPRFSQQNERSSRISSAAELDVISIQDQRYKKENVTAQVLHRFDVQQEEGNSQANDNDEPPLHYKEESYSCRRIGARAKDILGQFFTEAAALSLIAGIFGVLVAAIASAILNHFSTLETTLTGGMIALAFFFSAAVGVFFGYYPARKAASLNPIDALNYE